MRVTDVVPLTSPALSRRADTASTKMRAMTRDPTPVDGQFHEPFDAYYRRDYRQLVGLAYVLTGSQWAAEDLAHEALTVAHSQWSRVSGYDDPGAWVRRVMVNKNTSRFRKLRSETKALTRLGGRRAEVIAPSEASHEVWAAVRALPERQGQAVALFYWEDRTVAEIADILGCGTETVKTHLSRGRNALSERLGERKDWA